MHITKNNYRRLKKHPVETNDKVTFQVGDVVLQYTVRRRFLNGENCWNSRIFELLKVNKVEFCRNAYGYMPYNDCPWPECDDYDYEALSRVIISIFEEMRKL